MSTIDLDTLRSKVVPQVADYDQVASVTIAFKSTNAEGEQYILPSARGRITAVTFTVEAEEIEDYVKLGVDRLQELQAAGIFASEPAIDFPDVAGEDVNISIDVSL